MTPQHRTEGFSAHELGGPTGGLPLQLTSFVGRERELREIGACLDETRLLTLTGPGGSGKTRLALAATARLSENFEDGVRWVWLAQISDPALVAGAVAGAVGVREAPGLAPTEAIVEQLGDRELLLALDNCEHVVEACAVLADALLRFCPGLKILCTSRETLDVAGETAWAVPPLSLPAPGRPGDAPLERYEAVRLFVERAEVAAPGFALTPENAAAVARVCGRLDGIPLAIELAAARVKVLSVGQISDRLDDALDLLTGGSRTAPSRHKTLRGALDWSHGLLPEEEKALFRRMSVLVGEFTLDTAEKVCAGEDTDESDVLAVLSRLVDKSLVMVVGREDEASYRLLATVRQYAREKLDASGEEQKSRRRHAGFFLELAEGAEDALKGPGQEEWLDRLEGELGNLRAALDWFLECAREEDGEAGLRLAGALWRVWYLRGHYGQGRAWLEAALSCETPAARGSRARALTGAGVLALLQCEYGRAEEHLEEGMALYREACDARGEASALQVLGSVARERGLYEKAEAYHGESLRLWRGLGDEYEAARSLNYLGFVAWLQEEYEKASGVCEETLTDFRRFGDAEGIVWALINLGSATLYAGDPVLAEPLLEEALAASRRAGYKEGLAWSLNQLGVAARRRGDPERAEGLLRESLKVHRELGDKWRIASVLEGLAVTARAHGLPGRAARLFGAADVLRASLSAPTPPVERSDRDAALAAARTDLGDDEFDKALAAGRATPLEQAVALATAEAQPPRPTATMPHDLTAREIEVLGLVAEGLTDAQVAEKLFLSPRTVGHHLRSVYRKLRVPSRAAAATAALERGII